jgi:hypothetical protein
MRTVSIIAVLGLALSVAGCEKAGDPKKEPPIPPAEDSSAAPQGNAGERAREALGEAGNTARQTMQNLGEAGKAGVEALKENAPEIREKVGEAGQRVRNAADALLKDPSPSAPAGDSPADANTTPEAAESAQ